MAKGKVDARFFDFLMTSYPQKDHAHKHQQQVQVLHEVCDVLRLRNYHKRPFAD